MACVAGVRVVSRYLRTHLTQVVGLTALILITDSTSSGLAANQGTKKCRKA